MNWTEIIESLADKGFLMPDHSVWHKSDEVLIQDALLCLAGNDLDDIKHSIIACLYLIHKTASRASE